MGLCVGTDSQAEPLRPTLVYEVTVTPSDASSVWDVEVLAPVPAPSVPWKEGRWYEPIAPFVWNAPSVQGDLMWLSIEIWEGPGRVHAIGEGPVTLRWGSSDPLRHEWPIFPEDWFPGGNPGFDSGIVPIEGSPPYAGPGWYAVDELEPGTWVSLENTLTYLEGSCGWFVHGVSSGPVSEGGSRMTDVSTASSWHCRA